MGTYWYLKLVACVSMGTYICGELVFNGYLYSVAIPYSSKFLRSNNFVIFVRCKLITKFLSMKIFTPMGVSIGAAMNHEKCCL